MSPPIFNPRHACMLCSKFPVPATHFYDGANLPIGIPIFKSCDSHRSQFNVCPELTQQEVEDLEMVQKILES